MPDQFREESIKATLPEVPTTPDTTVTAAIRSSMAESGQNSSFEAFKAAVNANERTGAAASQLLINENIGTAVDASGKKQRSPEEQARLKSAEKSEKMARLLVEKGYDSPEFASLRGAARNNIEGMLTVWPELSALIPIDPAEKKQFLEEILRDQKFVAVVREKYVEAFSGDKKLSDEVTAARDALAAAKKTEGLLKKRNKETKDEIRDLDAVLAKFETGQPDAVELGTLTTNLPKNAEKVDTAQAQVDDLADEIKIYKAARVQAAVTNPAAEPAIVTRIGVLEIDKKAAEATLKKYSKLVERQKELATLKSTSESKLKTLRDTQDTTTIEFDAAIRARLGAQAIYEQASAQRSVDEQEFIEGLSIVGPAFVEYQATKLKAADAARKEQAEKAEVEATDRAEKAIQRQRQIRYEKSRTPTVLNSSTIEPNKLAIGQDMDTLTSRDLDKGPDRIIESMIKTELDKDVTAGKMTQVDADAYLAEKMKDKDFLTKVRPDIVRDLLAANLRSGQKIDRGRAELIATSEWGKGMINKAIAQNTELRQELENLKGQGIIKGDIMTAIKDHPGMLGILLAMIAGVVTVGVGAPLLIGAVGRSI